MIISPCGRVAISSDPGPGPESSAASFTLILKSPLIGVIGNSVTVFVLSEDVSGKLQEAARNRQAAASNRMGSPADLSNSMVLNLRRFPSGGGRSHCDEFPASSRHFI